MAVQLRVGGKYLNRLGVLKEITSATKDDPCMFRTSDGGWYSRDGSWGGWGSFDNRDLVEEVVEGKQWQVQTLDNQWVDAVDHGERRDSLVGLYYTDTMTGIRQHRWFRSDHIREKPIKKKHRLVQFVALYANGQCGNIYASLESCVKHANSVDIPYEVREVVFEWESE